MQQIKLADYQNSMRELGCSAELTDTVMQLLRSGDTQNAALLLRHHKRCAAINTCFWQNSTGQNKK